MTIWHQISNTFECQSTRIDKIEHRIEWQSTRIAAVEKRIETMSAELDALQAATRAIHDAVASANAKLTLMANEIARLKSGSPEADAVASLAGTIHADADALTSATAAAVV